MRRHPNPAAALLSELIDAFPAFQDSALCDGQRLTFARKAQVRPEKGKGTQVAKTIMFSDSPQTGFVH
jgi:hypothetical protein